MKPGSICTLKNRRNTRKPVFVAVYPDLELLLESRLKKNETIISTTTEFGTAVTGAVQPWGLKGFSEVFVLLREVVDSYGHFYYNCLYGDTRTGWIVKDKNFQVTPLPPLPEETDQAHNANKS